MLSFILSRAKQQPTYIVGGFISQLNSNAAAGSSDLFVLEADEYDHTFLSLKPQIAVITNIDWDHPDTYPTEADLHTAFNKFAQLLPSNGSLIVCGDDDGVQKLLPHHPQAITYGLQSNNQWQATNLRLNNKGGYTFEITYQGQLTTSSPIIMALPGLHNLQNGLAALIVAHTVGVPITKSALILSHFKGSSRRFELKGEVNGITIIDDYAHHPTELKATLAAARARFKQRPIWAVFQPHTFSRTKLLLDQFATAFSQADHVIILDIFPSREKDDGSISSTHLLNRMTHPDVHQLEMNEAITYLQKHLAPADVLITLGAGDGYKIGEALLKIL